MKRGILPLIFSVLWSIFPPSLEAFQATAVMEMKVKRIMLDDSTKTPTAVVILESIKGNKIIPIWIGSSEATSIAIELEHAVIPRPNTHDLIRSILRGVAATMSQITITDLRNNVYYARITLKYRGQELQIDSRPSDAIAVALRMNAPIYVASQVFAKARQLPSTKKPIPVTRRLMGLHVQDLTSQLATLLDLQIQQGVLVGDVEFGSPASKADIQRGDIVLRANDVVIHKVADLESFVKNTERPLHVQLKLLRKGEIVAVGFDLPS